MLSNRHAEDLPKIGGRIGADQQDLLSSIRQCNRRGTRQGCLADPALAREKQKSCRLFQETHFQPPNLSVQEQHEDDEPCRAFGITAAARFHHGKFGERTECDSCPTCQLSATWENAPTHNRIVHHDHGQAVVAMPFQLFSHKLARCEQGRLVCRIDSLHLDALPLQPLKVG